MLFKVWAQPKHVARWWGCAEAEGNVSFKVDLRVVGEFSADMVLESGDRHRIWGAYQEIKEPERPIFTWSWENTNVFRGKDTLVTLTFEDHDGKTKMTLVQQLFDDPEARDPHGEGWGASLDRLAGYLVHI